MKKNFPYLLTLFLFILLSQFHVVKVTLAVPDNRNTKWSAFAKFGRKWLDSECRDGDCNDTDIDRNKNIDFFDFALLAKSWFARKAYTITYDPYKDVDWDRCHLALAQHHDHMGRLSIERIKAYDRAGYNVIVAMDYAGKRSGGNAYCDYRLWPVHKYLAGFDSDEQVLATLNNIKLFIPAMEEIGCHHMTSPFLTTYIELWEPDYCETQQIWHYQSSQQCIDLINKFGAMAVIAHPIEKVSTYMGLQGYRGIEIVNAYFYRKRLLEKDSPDCPNYLEHFRSVWDYLLTYKDTKIWGFAVNDWYGPYREDEQAWIDSGKILVMISEYSLEEYRAALENGRFFSIHDRAEQRRDKNKYPIILDIIADKNSIFIDTDGTVNWIANGQKIAEASAIDLKELPLTMSYRYVRAEIINEYGTVFTQPWSVAIVPE